ncbi:hypothetical protein ACT5GY_07530 [Lactiplantibacillus plantarum]
MQNQQSNLKLISKNLHASYRQFMDDDFTAAPPRCAVTANDAGFPAGFVLSSSAHGTLSNHAPDAASAH